MPKRRTRQEIQLLIFGFDDELYGIIPLAVLRALTVLEDFGGLSDSQIEMTKAEIKRTIEGFKDGD